MLAAWGGFALSLLLYNAFLYLFFSTGAFWGFTVAVTLVCGLMACFFFDLVLILATSMAGSFLVFEGVGIVGGGYQNPFTIIEM